MNHFLYLQPEAEEFNNRQSQTRVPEHTIKGKYRKRLEIAVVVPVHVQF